VTKLEFVEATVQPDLKRINRTGGIGQFSQVGLHGKLRIAVWHTDGTDYVYARLPVTS
jgi:hypothetical protein